MLSAPATRAPKPHDLRFELCRLGSLLGSCGRACRATRPRSGPAPARRGSGPPRATPPARCAPPAMASRRLTNEFMRQRTARRRTAARAWDEVRALRAARCGSLLTRPLVCRMTRCSCCRQTGTWSWALRGCPTLCRPNGALAPGERDDEDADADADADDGDDQSGARRNKRNEQMKLTKCPCLFIFIFSFLVSRRVDDSGEVSVLPFENSEDPFVLFIAITMAVLFVCFHLLCLFLSFFLSFAGGCRHTKLWHKSNPKVRQVAELDLLSSSSLLCF